VFLGYSSSHLSYRCFDLASQRIYVSCYVRFHENVFLFANFEQIAPSISTSTQPTHLCTLITSPIFHPVDPPITPPNGSATLPAPQTQPPRSLPLFATIPSSHSPALMSPFAYFFDDHYVGTSSPSSELHLSRSVTTASTDFAAGSPLSATVNYGSLVCWWFFVFACFIGSRHLLFDSGLLGNLDVLIFVSDSWVRDWLWLRKVLTPLAHPIWVKLLRDLMWFKRFWKLSCQWFCKNKEEKFFSVRRSYLIG